MTFTTTPAGDFRHRLTILRRLIGPTNETGETTQTNYLTQTRWAKIETPTAEERYRAAEVYEDVSHVVTLRYTPDLTAADTLQFEGKTFDIASLTDPEERHIELLLLCKEQVIPTG